MCNRYTPATGRHPAFATMLAVSSDLLEPVRVTIGPRGQGRFLRPGPGSDAVVEVEGQWGMIRPGSATRFELAEDGRPKMTNNARSETMARLPTFRDAWKNGQRCLIPVWGYDEPNWESGQNQWWQVSNPKETEPLALAGLWSEWTDPESGELVPNFTMPTVNVDGHPLLARFHRPDPRRPLDKQDKRAVVALPKSAWKTWLFGTNEEALAVLQVQPAEALAARALPAPPRKTTSRQKQDTPPADTGSLF
ncbi:MULTISPECIES: SOS response-associated peptidase family protein [unclassified Variovorax]|uniref:SOS response-associated peptidase family protein n=1 Tax=unclassified Variovorax TaxID=663243 RepID=UPI0013164E7B|nr:hypothetical protein SRS16P1_00491 [Variovorax sp. SRS16]VTU43301.1 hypothetical protein H6P1_00414 [Variovorax sp. PBL-H6]VTU43318.1 hypothetical protein E5P1_00488 [Variovorax sp. PBL-E5]